MITSNFLKTSILLNIYFPNKEPMEKLSFLFQQRITVYNNLLAIIDEMAKSSCWISFRIFIAKLPLNCISNCCSPFYKWPFLYFCWLFGINFTTIVMIKLGVDCYSTLIFNMYTNFGFSFLLILWAFVAAGNDNCSPAQQNILADSEKVLFMVTENESSLYERPQRRFDNTDDVIIEVE